MKTLAQLTTAELTVMAGGLPGPISRNFPVGFPSRALAEALWPLWLGIHAAGNTCGPLCWHLARTGSPNGPPTWFGSAIFAGAPMHFAAVEAG